MMKVVRKRCVEVFREIVLRLKPQECTDSVIEIHTVIEEEDVIPDWLGKLCGDSDCKASVETSEPREGSGDGGKEVDNTAPSVEENDKSQEGASGKEKERIETNPPIEGETQVRLEDSAPNEDQAKKKALKRHVSNWGKQTNTWIHRYDSRNRRIENEKMTFDLLIGDKKKDDCALSSIIADAVKLDDKWRSFPRSKADVTLTTAEKLTYCAS